MSCFPVLGAQLELLSFPKLCKFSRAKTRSGFDFLTFLFCLFCNIFRRFSRFLISQTKSARCRRLHSMRPDYQHGIEYHANQDGTLNTVLGGFGDGVCSELSCSAVWSLYEPCSLFLGSMQLAPECFFLKFFLVFL